MRNVMWVALAAFVCGSAMDVQSQQAPSPGPSWVFPVVEGKLPPEPPGPKTVPGSTRKYTPEEIDNLLSPPDWFPDAHPPAPSIVVKGHGAALACGSCHLMNGSGHPESAEMTGLTAAYIIQQMADFKSGARQDYARMNAIAKETTDEEVRQAAEWFASLMPARTGTVVERAMVPQTFVGQGRMRFVREGGEEPIGMRIITIPEDQERARLRDPNSGFTSYVPPGSIARGKSLVETGGAGKSVACALCHGDNLKGLGNVPGLTGSHPIYTARQLYLFKDGRRNGVDAQLMKKAVAQMTDQDIIDVSAYLASLAP
jgi:cytochrome c553